MPIHGKVIKISMHKMCTHAHRCRKPGPGHSQLKTQLFTLSENHPCISIQSVSNAKNRCNNSAY